MGDSKNRGEKLVSKIHQIHGYFNDRRHGADDSAYRTQHDFLIQIMKAGGSFCGETPAFFQARTSARIEKTARVSPCFIRLTNEGETHAVMQEI